MAGFYPDVPAPRMPYDRDGSVGFATNGNTPSQLSQGQMQGLNSESYAGVSSSYVWVGLVFPQLRDIVGMICHRNGANTNMQIQTSVDSTNGSDGNWVVQVNPHNPGGIANLSDYRNNIESVTWNGIKAVRWRWNSSLGGDNRAHAHIYGSISNRAGLDSLRMWHPTLDEPLDDNTAADGAHLDWGDVTRGSTADRTFRIKNNSATLTANSINISTEALTNTSPTLESQVQYSDGGAFSTSLDIGSLGPGAISTVITVRRATDLSATMFLWTSRTIAEAGSWS